MTAPGWDTPTDPFSLRPAGEQAEVIERLWWPFLWVMLAVYVLVIGALAVAVWRRRAERSRSPELDPGPERGFVKATSVATAVSVVIVLGLTGASSHTAQALAGAGPADALTVKVTGQQWWWRIEYPGKVPSENVVTANELHVPVGRAVRIELGSLDVIHTLWVPELGGKRDLIPGRHNQLVVTARRPGVYRGQCAEFCGVQHAHMSLLVVAQSPAEFASWLSAQRAPAREPSSELEQRGRDVFLSTSCPLCHAIAGTDAAGSTGPDLTHLGARKTLAAGTFPNTRGHLAGWILDPQTVKTGNRMPPNALEADDLEALLAYLESLK